MDVRRFLLEHQIEERINLRHTAGYSGTMKWELNYREGFEY